MSFSTRSIFCGEMGLFLIKASAFEHGKEDFDALSLFVGLEWVVARCVAPGNHPIFFGLQIASKHEIAILDIQE